jgi:hypothetical protein
LKQRYEGEIVKVYDFSSLLKYRLPVIDFASVSIVFIWSIGFIYNNVGLGGYVDKGLIGL